MCCRYLLHKEHLKKVLAQMGIRVPEMATRYNIAPGTKIPAVRKTSRAETGCEFATLRWGLVPAWSKDGPQQAGLVNARVESLEIKASFREAFRARRCLIPASGFYEWKIAGRARLPWLFQLIDDEPFFLAGLWESWVSPDGTPWETCAVITTEPNLLMQPIHHRMPAILALGSAEAWLDPAARTEELRDLLRTFPTELLKTRPVSLRVNSAANDDPECLQSVDTNMPDGGQGMLAL
ncbi:MAG: SOS response-associated peptidase [Nibricoccus sp.]